MHLRATTSASAASFLFFLLLLPPGVLVRRRATSCLGGLPSQSVRRGHAPPGGYGGGHPGQEGRRRQSAGEGRRFPDFTIGKSGLTLLPRDAVRFPSYGLLALHPLLLLLLASVHCSTQLCIPTARRAPSRRGTSLAHHLKPAARPATATSTRTTHASAAADTRSSCRATTTMPARCAATVACPSAHAHSSASSASARSSPSCRRPPRPATARRSRAPRQPLRSARGSGQQGAARAARAALDAPRPLPPP